MLPCGYRCYVAVAYFIGRLGRLTPPFGGGGAGAGYAGAQGRLWIWIYGEHSLERWRRVGGLEEPLVGGSCSTPQPQSSSNLRFLRRCSENHRNSVSPEPALPPVVGTRNLPL